MAVQPRNRSELPLGPIDPPTNSGKRWRYAEQAPARAKRPPKDHDWSLTIVAIAVVTILIAVGAGIVKGVLA